MKAADWPRDLVEEQRLLVIDPRQQRIGHRRLTELPRLLVEGDVIVVNDAATLPALLRGTVKGRPIELRLACQHSESIWTALAFGDGSWRKRTEDREGPGLLVEGASIEITSKLTATVLAQPHARVLELRFNLEGVDLWREIYRAGRPVQYAYARDDYPLWNVQNRYASRPWSMEPPSAGLPLRWSLLSALVKRGVQLRALTHAAGLSSTGDAQLDATLPWPERYEIPADTVEAVRQARDRGTRVIAVGTTVVRALEGSALDHGGELTAGSGVTSLRIGPETKLRFVDGLLTGMHEPTASHFALMSAFAPRALLEKADAEAAAQGYLAHEFGDSTLILPGG